MSARTAHETARSRLTVEESARLAGVCAQLVRAYADSAASQRRLVRTLIELEPLGFTMLADRRGPGGSASAVDAVLVGPGGVFLFDLRAGSPLRLVDGRLLRGDLDATDEFAAFADLAHLVRTDVAEVGLPAGEVHALVATVDQPDLRAEVYGVRLLGERAAVLEIVRAGSRLTAAQVALVRSRVERLFPPLITGPIGVLPGALAADDAMPPESETVRARPGSDLLDRDELLEPLTAGLTPPPRECALFLEPRAARLVRRELSGPSRIHGPAGTGKSLLGLHRAAHLARETGGRVLVTAPSGGPLRVLAARMATLAPEAAERVEFLGVPRLAARLLALAGHTVRVDDDAVQLAFMELWTALPVQSPLRLRDDRPRVWHAEISSGIKARGLRERASYPADDGRAPLPEDARDALWRLAVDYDALLAQRGLPDGDDLVAGALGVVATAGLAPYSAVIADEAHDLGPQALRLLHALVGDRPDGLMLLDDDRRAGIGGPRAYAEAGIAFDGREFPLDVDHRHTVEILGVTGALLPAPPGAPDAIAHRHGERPVVVRPRDPAEHDAEIVARVLALRDTGADPSSIAVLAPSVVGARGALAALTAAGIACEPLAADPVGADGVRVGSFASAVGFEFDQVLAVAVPRTALELEPEDARADPLALQRAARREFATAAARARDGLWIALRPDPIG